MQQQQEAPLGPSDIPTLFQCLTGALSQNHNVQKAAEETLNALGNRTGFCSCLLEILGSKQADYGARFLAAVHLKNSVTKYWRPRSDQGFISAEEKAYLRGKLLDVINQETQQIAVQVAVVFAKIARIDFPRFWPTIFTDLLSKLSTNDTLTTRRVYLVLHHILKEISSKRLSVDQQNFAEVTSQLYSSVWSQWCSDTQTVTAGLSAALQNPSEATDVSIAMERWLVLLKALRRMVMYGFSSDARTLQQVPAVSQVLPALLEATKSMLQQRPPQPAVKSQLHAMLDRALLKLVKTMANIQEMHPWSTVHCECFFPLLDFTIKQVMEAHQRPSPLFERFYLQCMLLLHSVLRSPSYRGASSSFELSAVAKSQMETTKQMAAEVQAKLQAYWGGGRLLQLCGSLLRDYFPLTVREVEEWGSSPEEFHNESLLGAQEEHIRACAESLFLMLLQANREAVAPLIVQLLTEASTACPPGAAGVGGPALAGVPLAVLHKEAVYNAVTVAAYELQDYIDFQPWLRSTLLPELNSTAPEGQLLRRRAALLLGKWVAKIGREDRPAIYAALLGLLQQGDAALCLAGVSSLKDLIDDWEFNEEQFRELVGPCVRMLTAFLKSATEFDSKLQVFNLLNIIVERMGDSIRPHAEGILRTLPEVWEAEGQSLIRIQVLVALQRLVNALGSDSPAVYPLLVPILRVCTDPDHPDALNLLEDGLQLWLVALRNAPAPHAELLALFPHLATIMERTTEHIQVCTALMASVVLLGGAEFLQRFGPSLVATLAGQIGALKEAGMLLLFPVLDTILQAFPAEAPQLLEPALLRLLGAVLGGQESGVVVAHAVTIFARILLQNTKAFLPLFAHAAAVLPPPPPAPVSAAASPPPDPGADPPQRLLLAFVDLWLDKFDSMGNPGARKLSALALCMLLTLPLPPILQRLDLLAACITAVWFEAEGLDNGSGGGDYGYDYYAARYSEDSTIASLTVNSEDAEGESIRKRQLFERDPAHSVKLSSFLAQTLQHCAAVHGAAAFNAATSQLDPTLGSQLKAAATPTAT